MRDVAYRVLFFHGFVDHGRRLCICWVGITMVIGYMRCWVDYRRIGFKMG